MPAEWSRHEATWLSWPKDPLTWPDRVPEVERIFLRMMEALSQRERVRLLVDDEATEDRVRRELRGTGAAAANIEFVRVPTVDAWIRDYGPNFLLGSGPDGPRLAYNDWGFNAWGDKYEALKRDDGIPRALEPLLGVERFEPGVVLEGGSIDVNGDGVCLTTEQCLLHPNRNPGLSRGDLERFLRDFLGVRTVVWLGEGIVGDDTDGHIDDIARFVSRDTIVCALERDPADDNYRLLQDNHRRLQAARDAAGRPFRVVALPMPERVESPEGRLPASYANFYIANGVVLAPVFGHPADREALEILGGLFPGREIVAIDCEPLVWGLGAIHCVTQQQPAV